MRRAALWIAAAAALALASGCKGTGMYFRDRARDFGEMFRVQVGIGAGLGVSAQAGPVAHAGLGGGVIPYSLGVGWNYGRGYAFGLGGTDLVDAELYWPATLIGDGAGTGLGQGWHYAADLMRRRDVDPHHHVCYGFVPGLFARLPSGPQNPRGPFLWTPKGMAQNRWGHIHSWDVEAAAYAGVIVARVGFSPGEFLDFLLGWFGVDIANDDLASRPRPDFGDGDPDDE